MSLDLRTGRPVWLIKDRQKPKHPALKQDIVSEVAVIGGGVSGALIAHALTRAGREVILLDSREVAMGSTSASTAILSYETDTNLTELIKKIGEKSAVRVFKAGAEAIEYIGRVAGGLGRTCEFKKIDSLYFASRRKDAKAIEREYKIRKKHGFDLDFLDKNQLKQLFSFSAPCGLLTRNLADINPVKFTRALIVEAEKKGLKVFARTKVKIYKPHSQKPRAVTENGQLVTAKHFIFASGYETQEFLKQKSVRLISSFAIASKPVKAFTGWHARSAIWETARPYLYLRTTRDNRIVVGGEDVDFLNEKKRDALLAKKAKILQAKVKKMFPAIAFTLAAAWTGTFAESNDGLPYIGRHKKFPGAYFSLGYGGNGTVFAAIACRIITDLILGKKNSDAKIFRFGR